jgi:hypothetical protein
MQSQMKKILRGIILLLLGGASFTFVLSGCVTYYGKEPNRYRYQRESVPPPVAEPPEIEESAEPIPVFQQPPLMAWDSKFGMYFVLGSQNDLFFYGDYYYVSVSRGWYRSVSYNGPWLYTERVLLPPVFHSHRLEDLRHNREVIYREYKMRPDAFRQRMFDHREDHFRDHYDRGFMERNREQMRRDREFYSHHESRTSRTVSERYEAPVGNHEPLASKTISESHGPTVGNHEPLASRTVSERHEAPVGNHESLGQKQVKKAVAKPSAQKMAKKKLTPKKPVDKPEEKK